MPFTLAARFTIPPSAHIYWRHPGSSGLATEVVWDLPEGFSAAPLAWPAPERFEFVEIGDISYGYEDEVLLLSEITPPDGLSEESMSTLSARVSWLICLDRGQCIPGGKEVEIELPSGEGGPSEF
ncbi:MAG: protein-disulfide reductase DsbD family protein, partial [Candidatus Hydrogenedentes bacterium]|nr:protein-disulfide reductase DsbD family protein [Candidatus Hydrogenedentota bacterium]